MYRSTIKKNYIFFPQEVLFLFSFLQYKENTLWRGQISQTGCGETGRMFLLLQWPLAAPLSSLRTGPIRWEVPYVLISSRDSLFPHFLLQLNGHEKENRYLWKPEAHETLRENGPFLDFVKCRHNKEYSVVWDVRGNCLAPFLSETIFVKSQQMA